ncbi:hypothetical protein B7C51_13925 [Paenibacillus larvae subsp. pulvifaciens]|uniref:Uncharacterized protein n=1 Tax=Paenibacillus larvae subsp. pulvifaciens TaxID=1477 RepID=A0A1V0UUH7_9BACL|nr:hypothetical protein BXP28_18930 [Paenibacillus larvae subsp. larvae]ARF68662.1 hypothetical protein B7C51_13925 [Paenibacillus larvae subsp. pulvifaciens]
MWEMQGGILIHTGLCIDIFTPLVDNVHNRFQSPFLGNGKSLKNRTTFSQFFVDNVGKAV